MRAPRSLEKARTLTCSSHGCSEEDFTANIVNTLQLLSTWTFRNRLNRQEESGFQRHQVAKVGDVSWNVWSFTKPAVLQVVCVLVSAWSTSRKRKEPLDWAFKMNVFLHFRSCSRVSWISFMFVYMFMLWSSSAVKLLWIKGLQIISLLCGTKCSVTATHCFYF